MKIFIVNLLIQKIMHYPNILLPQHKGKEVTQYHLKLIHILYLQLYTIYGINGIIKK